MKIFKLLFSRMAFVALLILIQIGLLTFLIYHSFEYQVVGVVVSSFIVILQIIFFFIIINRKDSPELKIPWLTIIFVIPIAGVLIFFFFANFGLPKKQKKELDKMISAIAPYSYVKNRKVEEFDKTNIKDQGIIHYLNNVQGTHGYNGNSITYFKNGETFFPDLISKLKEAKQFILMEFFIVDYGKEWDQILAVLKQKAKEGVTIKFMFDDVGCLSTLKRKFVKEMNKLGIETYAFNKFRPVMSGIFNNRDHRKICVVDHKYGYTGGINLADEYANEVKRFGYWKDSMIRIEGPAIHNLIVLFFTTFDANAEKESNYKKFLQGDYENKGDGYAFAFGDGPRPYMNETIGEQTFINLFNAARKTIYISSPYLIPTYNLTQAIRNAGLRGVDVHLIVPGIPDKKIVYLMAKNNFAQLLEAGIHIYTFTPGFNHEKAIVVDDEIAFIGTINLDYRSLIHHFECGAIIYHTKAITDMSTSLKETINQSKAIPSDFKLNWFKSLICKIINVFASML